MQRRRWLALAASVVLAVAIAGGCWSLRPDKSLQKAVLALFDDEPFALDARDAINVTQVHKIAQPMQSRIDDSVGTVRFASICEIGNADGVHLVVNGNKGSLLPHKSVSRRVAVHNDRFDGIIVPRTVGSKAIVGKRGEALNAVEARVGAAVHQL